MQTSPNSPRFVVSEFHPLSEMTEYRAMMNRIKKIQGHCLIRIEADDMPHSTSDEFNLMREALTLGRFLKEIGSLVVMKGNEEEKPFDAWEEV